MSNIEKALEALNVPKHKQNDAEFLRASCNLAKSFLEAASTQEAPAPTEDSREALQSMAFNLAVDLGDKLFGMITGDRFSWNRYEVSKAIEAVILQAAITYASTRPQASPVADICLDEGCPHFNKAVKCEPKPGGCIATVAQASPVGEVVEEGLLDEIAFNAAFEENKLYKPDIDHHWLYCFVSYYESAKGRDKLSPARDKLSLTQDVAVAILDAAVINQNGSGDAFLDNPEACAIAALSAIPASTGRGEDKIETDVAFKLSRAAEDVFMERKRQVMVEGWTPEHDDEHGIGEMADAAAAYAIIKGVPWRREIANRLWPWDVKWWKPKGRRQNLVRAGALIIAEIERLDRALTQPQEADGGEGEV